MTKGRQIFASTAIRRVEQDLVPVVVTVHVDSWLREEAESRGWRLALWNSGLRLGYRPRGALVSQLPGDALVRQLRQEGCPVVRLGNLPHPADASVPAVLPDDEAAGAMAADHFFERGFRNVGYFGRNPWSLGHRLFQGFRRRARTLGMDCHLYRSRETKGQESPDAKHIRRRHEFDAWVNDVPKPFGLLAAGAWFAVQSCDWLEEVGIAVPGEVAVLSPGDTNDLCNYAFPPISSIDRDEEGRMRAACALLDCLMAGEAAPKKAVMIPPRGVVTRQTTDVLSATDPRVAEALRFMWGHLDRELSVDVVADEVGISRRHLERLFDESLGRSVVAELQRRRVVVFRDLLLETDRPIADLAPMVGFRTMVHLRRCFRKAYGISPSEYRDALRKGAGAEA